MGARSRRRQAIAAATSLLVAVGGLTLGAATTGTASAATRAATASPDPGGTWHSPVLVTHNAAQSLGDRSQVNAISCGAAGECSAVGYYSGTPKFAGSHVTEGFIADETGGTWGKAQLLGNDNDGIYEFTAISCASAGDCAAVGDYSGGTGSGFVIEESGGTWGKPRIVADELTTVSCPAAGRCTAAGTQGYGGKAVVVGETAGKWEKPHALAGSRDVDAAITSISCVSAGNCSAGGYWDAQPFGPLPGVGYVLVADETNGTWGPAQTVEGSFTHDGDIDVDSVTSVSCSSAGNCSAGGYFGTYDGATHAFVVSESNHVWSPALEVAATLGVSGAQISSISCPGDGDCSAGGFYLDNLADPQAFVVDQSNGTWQPAEEVAGALNVDGYAELTSIACASTGNCSAGGWYANSSGGFVGLVVTQTNGTWGPGEAVATTATSDATAQVNGISCPAVGNCAAGGVMDNADDYLVAFVVTETPTASTPTITSFSPKSGAVGTTVTIVGTGLSGATKVTFGTKVATIAADTTTKIKVKVPVGATTGKITVITPAGTVKTASVFTVT